MTNFMYTGYFQFRNELGESYGSFEVFYADSSSRDYSTGYYWHACQPGCMPDGEALGPFESARAAYNDAMGDYGDYLTRDDLSVELTTQGVRVSAMVRGYRESVHYIGESEESAIESFLAEVND